MKQLIVRVLLVLGLLSFSTACGRTAPGNTPDTRATVAAALAATTTAQAGFEAAVSAAVDATATAVAAAGESMAAQTTAAATTGTSTSTAEYVTMSEEELAALIDEAVNEAVTATQTYSTSTTEATADGNVSAEEVQTIEVYVAGAEEAIAYAEDLIAVYDEQYGELASESLDTLAAIEEDLAAIATNTAAINETLGEINATLEAGLELAEETVSQLEDAAAAATAATEEVRAEAQTWLTTVQAENQKRVEAAQNIPPSRVATNPQEALQSTFEYVDVTRNAIGDNKISQKELFDVAQAGANANASLKGHGGPELQKLGPSINGTTQQLARGDVPGARNTLGGLEAGLPNRSSAGPSGPSAPTGGAPQPGGGSRPSSPGRRP